jgi:four helix bundle protein
VRDHRKLDIFQLADSLVVLVYEVTRQFPAEERYGLVSQIRRSAVSVPTNIVEGCGRRTDVEFNRFLDIAFGSVRELGYLIDLASRLGYLKGTSLDGVRELHGRTSAALASFLKSREPC